MCCAYTHYIKMSTWYFFAVVCRNKEGGHYIFSELGETKIFGKQTQDPILGHHVVAVVEACVHEARADTAKHTSIGLLGRPELRKTTYKNVRCTEYQNRFST